MDRESFIILTVVCGGILATLSFVMFESPVPKTSINPKNDRPGPRLSTEGDTPKALSPEHVPLSTGDEPIDKLFIESGCATCHMIPGIPAAKGREGPLLSLGLNGPRRLEDPNYGGSAETVREYIIESILDPGAYVVPGYPDGVMPRWYGKKLNAKALDRITNYLEKLGDKPG